MDLRFSSEQEAFRAEVRAWLADHVPGEEPPILGGPELVEFQRRWQSTLASARLVAVHWPAVFGGRGLGWVEGFIVQEEVALARAPEIVNRIAVNLVGPTLLEHGTPDQRERFLQRDRHRRRPLVPALQRARRGLRPRLPAHDGRPGGGRLADQRAQGVGVQRAVLPLRDPLGPHGSAAGRGGRGRPPIGYFLLTMDQPGIEVRPLRQMTGESEFNEVFLDGAFVPTRRRRRSRRRLGGHAGDAGPRALDVAPPAHRALRADGAARRRGPHAGARTQ